MSRYSLNLPTSLKQDAEDWATRQEVSLNQFILWAVAEKIGALKQQLDDPRFPLISYRLGASHRPTAVIRGTGVRVQTVAVATHHWGMSPEQIAEELDLGKSQVKAALAFFEAHQSEIEAEIADDPELEPQRQASSSKS